MLPDANLYASDLHFFLSKLIRAGAISVCGVDSWPNVIRNAALDIPLLPFIRVAQQVPLLTLLSNTVCCAIRSQSCCSHPPEAGGSWA